MTPFSFCRMGKDLWDRIGPNSSSAHGSDSHYSHEVTCTDGVSDDEFSSMAQNSSSSDDECSSMAQSSSSSEDECSSLAQSSSSSDDECSSMAHSTSSSGDSIDHEVGGSPKAPADDSPEYVVQDILDMRLKVSGGN